MDITPDELHHDIEMEKLMLKRRLEDERNFFRHKHRINRHQENNSQANLNHRVLSLARQFDAKSHELLNSSAEFRCRVHSRAIMQLEQGKDIEQDMTNHRKVNWGSTGIYRKDEIASGSVPFASSKNRREENEVRRYFKPVSRQGPIEASTAARKTIKMSSKGGFSSGNFPCSENSIVVENNNREARNSTNCIGSESGKNDKYIQNEISEAILKQDVSSKTGPIGRESFRKISHKDATRVLLTQAIDQSDFALLRVMLRMSPHVKNYFNDKDPCGNNLIHRCCKDGNHRLASVLVEIGMDVNMPGEKMRTPLHIASGANDVDIARLLLNSCADLHRRDEDGLRPVDLCTDPKLRTMLLRKMSTRTRSFSSKKKMNRNHHLETNLSRTDSGIVTDECFFDESKDSDYLQGSFLSTYKNFKFAKETSI